MTADHGRPTANDRTIEREERQSCRATEKGMIACMIRVRSKKGNHK